MAILMILLCFLIVSVVDLAIGTAAAYILMEYSPYAWWSKQRADLSPVTDSNKVYRPKYVPLVSRF